MKTFRDCGDTENPGHGGGAKAFLKFSREVFRKKTFRCESDTRVTVSVALHGQTDIDISGVISDGVPVVSKPVTGRVWTRSISFSRRDRRSDRRRRTAQEKHVVEIIDETTVQNTIRACESDSARVCVTRFTRFTGVETRFGVLCFPRSVFIFGHADVPRPIAMHFREQTY